MAPPSTPATFPSSTAWSDDPSRKTRTAEPAGQSESTDEKQRQTTRCTFKPAARRSTKTGKPKPVRPCLPPWNATAQGVHVRKFKYAKPLPPPDFTTPGLGKRPSSDSLDAPLKKGRTTDEEAPPNLGVEEVLPGLDGMLTREIVPAIVLLLNRFRQAP